MFVVGVPERDVNESAQNSQTPAAAGDRIVMRNSVGGCV
jgi:hypothetical protein